MLRGDSLRNPARLAVMMPSHRAAGNRSDAKAQEPVMLQGARAIFDSLHLDAGSHRILTGTGRSRDGEGSFPIDPQSAPWLSQIVLSPVCRITSSYARCVLFGVRPIFANTAVASAPTCWRSGRSLLGHATTGVPSVVDSLNLHLIACLSTWRPSAVGSCGLRTPGEPWWRENATSERARPGSSVRHRVQHDIDADRVRVW